MIQRSDDLLTQVKEAVENVGKLKYWRSAEHRDRAKAYLDDLNAEFESTDTNASESAGLQRRDMLKLMGASFALAGVGVACRRPEEKILPYTKTPENIVPGIAQYFATAIPGPAGAIGLLVESHEGRPTKVEGNKEHPASLGATSAYAQASVLQMYDPDRSRTPMMQVPGGRVPATWNDWDSFCQTQFNNLAAKQGQGLFFVCNEENSSTRNRLQAELKKKFPNSQWYAYDPYMMQVPAKQKGWEAALGEGASVNYKFDGAKVIFALQNDFIMAWPTAHVASKGFSSGRKIYKAEEASKMNRLYVVEADFTVTGTNADHRLRLPVSQSAEFLRALTKAILAVPTLKWPASWGESAKTSLLAQLNVQTPFDQKWLNALAKDMVSRQGESLVVVGEQLDEASHALAHVLNELLGTAGKTYEVRKAPANDSNIQHGAAGLADLASKLEKGEVDTLVIFDTNIAYAAPGALNVAKAIARAKTSVHVGLYDDETGALCSWHLPMAHFMETWGDLASFDGTATVQQPLIAPLHGGRSVIEAMAQMAGITPRKPYGLVQQTWRDGAGLLASEKAWRKAVHDGVVAGTGYAVANASANVANVVGMIAQVPAKKAAPAADNIEVVFKKSYSVLDGRGNNLGWLQELPDPITRLTWGNALLVGPKFAKELGVKSGIKKRIYTAQLAKLQINGQTARLPIFVLPGLPDYSVVVSLGYGRTRSGDVGNGVGVDLYPFLPKDGNSVFLGAKIELMNEFEELATTQEQFAMNGNVVQEVSVLSMQNRNPTQVGTVEEYQKNPKYAPERIIPENLLQEEPGSDKLQPAQMTKPWTYQGNKWGMVIDLTSCTGCNGCVTACQAENNTPVVGVESVKRSRVMHWLRIDRYFTGDVNDPMAVHQPVNCMHCENAPCEPVCPVAATTHDTEGLNAMAYNRCIGTRYCANNCPYKVRRFNYFDFSHSGNIYVPEKDLKRRELLEMQYNPDVTIRYRGVMEKCTYCTQRIQEAKMAARRNHEDPNNLKDGAVTPACAQACSTGAITFGNLNDENSQVSILKKVDRNYDMLNELNTRPRTSYLAKIRNPNPELVS